MMSDDDEQVQLIPIEPRQVTRYPRQQYSRISLTIYTLCWFGLLFFGPLWVNSFDITINAGYNITPADPGILMDPFPLADQCRPCGEWDPDGKAWDISFTSDLMHLPATGTAPVFLATVSNPTGSGKWWVADTSEIFLTTNPQRWTIPTEGCFGAPGRLYVVTCFPREGVHFNQGDHVDGPPFDTRCFALGSVCGGSCGTLINAPPLCEQGSIPYELLVSPGCTDPLQDECIITPPSLEKYGAGIWAFCFFYMSFLSLVVFLLNHCAPVAGFLELFIPRIATPRDVEDCTVGVASIFCSEGSFHEARNLFGIMNAWKTVNAELPNRKVKRVHYILDNSLPKDAQQSYLHEIIVPILQEVEEADLEHLCFSLKSAPFRLTRKDYQSLYPPNIRFAIQRGIQKIEADQTGPEGRCGPYYPYQEEFIEEQFAMEVPKRYNLQQVGFDDSDPEYSAREYLLHLPDQLEVKLVILSAKTPEAKAKAKALANCAKYMIQNEGDGKRDLFLALMDARHMMSPDFWANTIPHLLENANVRWVQVMQYFPVLNKTNDYFDRGNLFNYLYANLLRNVIRATTSCGTNALWCLKRRLDKSDFTFKGETRIEDTETSHHCFDYNEESVYVPHPLGSGSVKDPTEYGEAPSRWSCWCNPTLWC